MFSYSHNLGSRAGKNHNKKATKPPFPWTVAFYLKAVLGLTVLQEILAGLGQGQTVGEADKQQKKVHLSMDLHE